MTIIAEYFVFFFLVSFSFFKQVILNNVFTNYHCEVSKGCREIKSESQYRETVNGVCQRIACTRLYLSRFKNKFNFSVLKLRIGTCLRRVFYRNDISMPDSQITVSFVKGRLGAFKVQIAYINKDAMARRIKRQFIILSNFSKLKKEKKKKKVIYTLFYNHEWNSTLRQTIIELYNIFRLSVEEIYSRQSTSKIKEKKKDLLELLGSFQRHMFYKRDDTYSAARVAKITSLLRRLGANCTDGRGVGNERDETRGKRAPGESSFYELSPSRIAFPRCSSYIHLAGRQYDPPSG
ncbi:hypothetical protein PUN28_003395 [Cardiocondyla obscurior]|uniref:Uncharacterized protein n=1 Tax=Cardiocondyla obscurior TaxID=286306 RepID=A0AAW2GNB5_9HYME